MSDCLHCDINQLVQGRLERGEADVGELASMMVESLADLVLLAPEASRPTCWPMWSRVWGRCSWRRVARGSAARVPLIRVGRWLATPVPHREARLTSPFRGARTGPGSTREMWDSQTDLCPSQ